MHFLYITIPIFVSTPTIFNYTILTFLLVSDQNCEIEWPQHVLFALNLHKVNYNPCNSSPPHKFTYISHKLQPLYHYLPLLLDMILNASQQQKREV